MNVYLISASVVSRTKTLQPMELFAEVIEHPSIDCPATIQVNTTDILLSVASGTKASIPRASIRRYWRTGAQVHILWDCAGSETLTMLQFDRRQDARLFVAAI